MAMTTRTAAWSADGPANGWTDALVWYAAGIHQMKLLTPGIEAVRPVAQAVIARRNPPSDQVRAAFEAIASWTDPTSLGYQSQVHDTFLPRSNWPQHNGKPVLWAECAHTQWFFLPWHRAYLLEFEAVVRSHVKALDGPETWALPYWNSSDHATLSEAAQLPRPLRGEFLPDGVEVPGVEADEDGRFPNPLFEPTRTMTGPSGLSGPPSAADWPDASDALSRHHFATATDADTVSFGGGYLEDLTHFHFSNESGQLDAQPHGTGHVHVGGLMGLFETAGLDPVFWMHHANVDRLWETYAHDLGHGYPFEDGPPGGGVAQEAFDSWSSRVFEFLRPVGDSGKWKAPGVLDIQALGYSYDTTAPPTILPVSTDPAGQDIEPFGLAPGGSFPVAAADDVHIGDDTEVTLQGGGDDDPLGGVPAGARWHVRFDGIRSQAPAVTSYGVYLGLGPDEQPDPTDPEHFIGVLSLFGVFEASQEDTGNLGQRRRLTASTAAASAGFDPLNARLRLVPTEPDRSVADVGLVVDRISLDVRT
jgi:tyrosinase